MDFGISGKVALITGSGGSLGAGEAIALAEAGCHIMVHDIREEACLQTVEKLRPYGVKTAYYVCDVKDAVAVRQMIEYTVETLGSIDILINNAGMNIHGAGRLPFCDYIIENFDFCVDLNVNGAFYCSKYAAPYMIKKGWGRIINISSVEGLQGNRLQPAYVTAKAAMISMTRTMAEELGPYGITVTSVAPGSAMNPRVKATFYEDKEKAARILSNIPAGRPGQPEDIAAACLYLASEQGGYVNGQTLVVDGGWIAAYSRPWPVN